MEDLFNANLPDGERPDIQLCVFPHLKEFLVIDLRESLPQISLLNATDVFTDDFFQSVEEDFSQAIRNRNRVPLRSPHGPAHAVGGGRQRNRHDLHPGPIVASSQTLRPFPR